MFINITIPLNTVTMSSHEEDDQDIDREDIHVDVESMDSKASCGGASDSEIDMDDTGSCYDDTEIHIRCVGALESHQKSVVIILNFCFNIFDFPNIIKFQ